MANYTSRQLIASSVLIACVLISNIAVAGQPPRTRTLTYDPNTENWVETPPPTPGTPAGDIHGIRVLIREGRYRRAVSAANKFVKVHGTSDPLYPEALLTKAEALIAMDRFDKAHRVIQEFLNEFGGATLTAEALRLQFVIAEAYLAGAKRRVWGLPVLSGVDTAYELLDEISTGHPDSRLAVLAIKTKADHMFRKGDYTLAELEYDRLVRDYPQGQYSRFALRRIADAALASFAGIEYDDSALIEAEERYRDYVSKYPASDDRDEVGRILDTINENRAGKELSVGSYYERTGHLSSAVAYYQSVGDNWPDSNAATRASARLELLGAVEPAARRGEH